MISSRNPDLSIQNVITSLTIQANHNGSLKEERDDDVPKTHSFSLIYSPCNALYYTHYSLCIYPFVFDVTVTVEKKANCWH